MTPLNCSSIKTHIKNIVISTVRSKKRTYRKHRKKRKRCKNGSVHITHYWVDLLRQLVPVIVLLILLDKKQAIIRAGLLGDFDEWLPPPTNSGQLEVGHLLESCIYDCKFLQTHACDVLQDLCISLSTRSSPAHQCDNAWSWNNTQNNIPHLG
jgi:hypothetical protein